MGLTPIGTRADDRRTEPPPTKRTGLIRATCRRGLRPPMGLTPIGTRADDRRTEPPPTKKPA